MVGAAGLRPFEIADDVVAMRHDRAHEDRQERRIERSARRPEQVERHQQVGHPDADVHRACPVHAVTRRITRDPVEYLRAEFRGQPRIGRGVMGESEVGQVLQAGQLPRHLDVGASDLSKSDVAIPGPFGPAISAAKIHLPIDALIVGRQQGGDRITCAAIRGIDCRRHRHRVPVPIESAALHAVEDSNPARAEKVEAMLEKERHRPCVGIRRAGSQAAGNEAREPGAHRRHRAVARKQDIADA